MRAELRKVHTHLIAAIFELKDLKESDNVQYRNSARTITSHISDTAQQITALMETLSTTRK